MKKLFCKILLAIDVLAFLLLAIFSQFIKVFDAYTGVMTDGFGRVLSKTPPILRTAGIYEWAGSGWSAIDTIVAFALILIAVFFCEQITDKHKKNKK